MNSLANLKKEISSLADTKRAQVLQRFFRTGPGEYGEGDVFLGISVPKQREIAKKYGNMSLGDIRKLLANSIHEYRLIALLILVDKYQKAVKLNDRKKVVVFYLKNTQGINNWDLVDLSVYKILGDFLLRNPSQKNILDKLAGSKNLWEKRMAMVATYAFIGSGSSRETIQIAKKLLNDKHDLIHKAVGWMLREVGKRVSEKTLTDFLDQYSSEMARTTLRYAIERLAEKKRQYYLNK